MQHLQDKLDGQPIDIDVDETPFGAEAVEEDHAPPVAHHPASGAAYALAAYGWWGFVVPLFFWWLGAVGAIDLLAVRIVTGLPVALAIVAWGGRTRELIDALRSWKTYRYLALTTALISVNWFGFIYVITTDGLELQASLGYYITPLISVALGMVVLGERLRVGQWIAVALGLAGVGVLAIGGEPPTWALALAFSFGFYGLLRKRAHVGPIVGITVEMGNLFIPALAFLAWRWSGGDLRLAELSPTQLTLIFGAGAITVLPLLWFNHGARRLRLSTLGFIQFLAPTGQFLLAIALMGEAFGPVRVATFALIWVAILAFLTDSVRHHRRERRA